jgi:hypothetical protein
MAKIMEVESKFDDRFFETQPEPTSSFQAHRHTVYLFMSSDENIRKVGISVQERVQAFLDATRKAIQLEASNDAIINHPKYVKLRDDFYGEVALYREHLYPTTLAFAQDVQRTFSELTRINRSQLEQHWGEIQEHCKAAFESGQ